MACILVVEDEILLRYPLAQWLRSDGNDVLEAASGDEAQAVLSSVLTIDVVVTDVTMPGSLDGLQLARNIRATKPQIPVIVVSGNALQSDAKSACAPALFRKPYEFDEIAERVAELIAQRIPPDDQSTKRATGDYSIRRCRC
jgi:CheY-like chemotaxis protein